jgi:hypothetical protein
MVPEKCPQCGSLTLVRLVRETPVGMVIEGWACGMPGCGFACGADLDGRPNAEPLKPPCPFKCPPEAEGGEGT